MGFVARKVVRDKDSKYLPLLPRAWKYIERQLSHPLLLPLKTWLDKVVSYSIRNNINNSNKILA